MAFKDQVLRDLDIFLNPDEFATKVIVDGLEVNGIIDLKDDAVLDGDYNATVKTITLKRADVQILKNGSIITIDDEPYVVIHIFHKDPFVIKAYISKDTRPRF